MIRPLEIHISELVVHGDESFDPASFQRDLVQALNARLSSGARSGPTTADPIVRGVADRIVASLPPSASGRDRA